MRVSLAAALALTLAACDSADLGPVVATDTVVVSYVGRLEDGSVFDQSPRTSFFLGDVIPGFRAGIVGMTVGETKTIEIPPEQGYGEEGVVTRDGEVIIPPNATLYFEVELLAIE